MNSAVNSKNALEEIESRKVRVDYLHYIFAIITTITLVTVVIYSRNPDTDAYFLIDNGRYILQNKALPTINIWTMHKGFNIVIQQWICSTLNYIAYALGGWCGIKILAMLECIVFNLALAEYTAEYVESKKIKVIIHCIINLAFCLYFTTRPYPITMAIMLHEVTVLHKYYTHKIDTKKLYINLCLISLFSINYQSATWYFMFIYLLPYIIPWVFIKNPHRKSLQNDDICTSYDKLRKSEKRIRISILRIVPFMLCLGFINPNGINGIKYLWNSFSVVGNGRIMEMIPPSFKSLAGGVIVIFIILMMIYLLKNKDSEKPLLYLSFGSLMLALMIGRNNCMLIFGLVPFINFVLKDIINDNVHKKSFKSTRGIIICEYMIGYIIILAISTGIISACQKNMDLYDRHKMAEYLNQYNKDYIVLYTDFNTGAYFEFRGYKTYIDARPELYQKRINGKEDVYTEYINMLNQAIDTEDFLKKYNFTHLVVERPSILDTYLYYSNKYKLVIEDDTCRLYERLH